MTLIVECLINVSIQVDGVVSDGQVFPPHGEWGFHDTVNEGVLKKVLDSVGHRCIRTHVLMQTISLQ